jgi:hypothetical protein
MAWRTFIEWGSGPGLNIIIGAVLSFVVEYWPAFLRLDRKWRRLVFAGLCLIVPLAFALLRVLSGDAALSWDPLLWQAVLAGAASFGAGTLADTRSLRNKDSGALRAFLS